VATGRANKRKRGKRETSESRRARAATPSLTLLEDVSAIIARSHDLRDTLDQIVQAVAERMTAEVCSLYILDPKEQQLTLWATTGLDHSAVGKVRMGVEEGLTGFVIQKMAPVVVLDAPAHPRYKYFPETSEERYHSFFGVPVAQRGSPLGVLVVQTLRRRRASREEVRLLKTIASQVAVIIAQGRILEDLRTKEEEREAYRNRMLQALRRLRAYEARDGGSPDDTARQRPQRLSGLPASPGFGRGRTHLLLPAVRLEEIEERRSDASESERARFQRALSRSVDEVAQLKRRMFDRLPDLDHSIFDAHRLMLEDKRFNERIERQITDGYAAETAVKYVIAEYVRAFDDMTDDYLRDRGVEIKDIGQRLLRNLLGLEESEKPLAGNAVLMAEELTLSDLSELEHGSLKGIVLATGGVTSHASILAKSFEIPTVVGVDHLLESVREGDEVVVDGNAGVVYVNPTAEVVREYERIDREYRAFNRELESLRNLPAETRDGRRIALYANVGLVGDLELGVRHGAEGVGLYRTELPFLTYRQLPTEEEQLQLYTRVIRVMDGCPVTIRTLDLGADKYPPYMRLPREENPFLGWRSIRISLEMADLFKQQLRAILRAGALGRVRILFPMISSVEEIRRAKELLEEAKAELKAEGREFDSGIKVGIMIEVPSAIWLANQLIREVDFFSIGTNDLIQYLLAVDRNNRKVASLYEPLHPAVLAAIHEAVQAAKGAGKWVGMCGEMAADPLCTLVLLGMGLDDLSMEPFFVPVVKRVVRSVTYDAARSMVRDVLTMEAVKDVKGFLFDDIKRLGLIDILEMYH
jgi:phosphotransferase system enzyme I (PtsP)